MHDLLQRKCAFGQHTTEQHGECTECRKNRVGLQRQAVSQNGPEAAPPIVHEVLRSPGQTLDVATRAYMETRFGHDFSRVQVQTVAPKQIQTKLTVNQPSDPFEQDANRIAEQVMRMPDPEVQRQCACGGTSGPMGECEECRQRRLGLQFFAEDLARPASPPPMVYEVLRSPGSPLDSHIRAFMEPRFGYDFSGVRVHTSMQAAKSAQAVNALAYTTGKDIVFGMGQYAPNTIPGRWLLAHELSHVVQQRVGRNRSQVLQEQTSTINNGDLKTEKIAKKHSLSFQHTYVLHGLIQRQASHRDPDCENLLVQIIARLIELKERADALIRNPLNLPPTGPMSVDGHQQQFRNKQTNLRSMLNQWDTNNCGPGYIPQEAWRWATSPTPSPAPSTSSQRIFEPPRSGVEITTEEVVTTVSAAAGIAVAGYIAYRVVRFLPSLLPPLWWTAPANLAIP
jgi:hypothetical protein